jgi:hypothetical protein
LAWVDSHGRRTWTHTLRPWLAGPA